MLRPERYQSKTFPSEKSGNYGVQSSLRMGLKQNQSDLNTAHPLEDSEKSYDVRTKQSNLTTLRNIQGVHAPLKIQMELNAVNKAVTRLPSLPSSNFAKDILNGTDDLILPSDVFGSRLDSEVIGDPHLMMEHKLGLKPL
ncbi:proteasome maturation protein-like [Clavelina lepadiformis]|uniref:Proteasome maturation protein n=1 Tax=Clavelina lepadiformis TaxID=159417 RepID=A0ABP0G0N6_CLALP